MRPFMKTLAPALLLLLGACFRPQAGGEEEDRDTRIAKVGQQSESAQLQRLKSANVTDADVTDAPGSSTPEIDIAKKLEFVDVYVEMGDPTGMRALVPYLLKPETWTLIKCEMQSSTSKHYRFQRVASNDGKSLPDVDLFKSRR
jgi:hypothetical protein